jgi:3'(2'), 5'-bisphosphate nucleotidase
MKDLLLTAINAALEAGDAIGQVYRRDFAVASKQDQSPLTQADCDSHEIILRHLSPTGIPVLSEEGRDIPYGERAGWVQLWIVDPLDGTKEFIKRNGEFTVNIALVAAGSPLLGVVLAPEMDRLYFGARELGAWRASTADVGCLLKESRDSTKGHLWEGLMGVSRKLPLPDLKPEIYTIVGSRSHATPELAAFIAAKRAEYPRVEFISAGSSLKICLVAEGAADIYPRLGPTMEWDTAAGQGVVEAAGGRLIDADSRQPLRYNRQDLLNPWFYVLGVEGEL